MQKPNNYDETQAGGEFTPVELGGHKLIIKQVNETKSKTGKDMIVVLFDFAEDDKQPGYFMSSFRMTFARIRSGLIRQRSTY